MRREGKRKGHSVEKRWTDTGGGGMERHRGKDKRTEKQTDFYELN